MNVVEMMKILLLNIFECYVWRINYVRKEKEKNCSLILKGFLLPSLQTVLQRLIE